MTTEIEKTFFETFGIKPKKGCTAYDKFTEEEADVICNDKCAECSYLDDVYPQITDYILLELICFLSEWRTYLHSSYTIKANNTLNLKQDVLKDFLELFKWYEFKKCEKGIKPQIQALFEK